MSEKIKIKLDPDNEMQLRAFQWLTALCSYAHKDSVFLADFWGRLMEHEDVYEEFCYYMEHGDYLCHVKISGYTVIDIMIWQMDRFKADLDQDCREMKQNGDLMLLMAFDTLLKMKVNPAPYVTAMQSDTGTDYVDKY